MKEYISHSIEDTKKIAKELQKYFKPNFYFLLSGDLGAGKTTFTKQFLELAGVQDRVSSPTFVIMNQYDSGKLNINHMDAYRLSKSDELDMYLEEFEDSFNIIEWYENIDLDLDNLDYIKINIKRVDDTTRKFEVEEKK